MAGRTLRLVKEFLFPDSVEHRGIPVLDGGLSANDDLDAFDELVPAGRLEPVDVAVAGDPATPSGDVLVSAGAALWRIGPDTPTPRVVAELPGEAGPLAAGGGALLAGAAGEGLVRVDPSGATELVAAEADGRRLGCLTAVAVAPDGRVYATEGSTVHGPADWPRDLLERRRAGRLVEIDPRRGTARVVAGDLGWPAGVCPAGDGDGLLVTEAWRHRILRVDPATGETQVVRDNLPGYPAQLHPAGPARYWLSFLSLRSHLVEFVLREDEYRRDMLASVPPEFWIRPALRTTGDRWEPLQMGQVKHLNVTKPWAPPRSYGLVARMDGDGVVDASFHSRAGAARHGCLSARQHGGRLLVACAGGRTVLTTTLTPTPTAEARP